MAKPEQPKPAAEGTPAPAATEGIAECVPAAEPEAEAFTEAEPDAIERKHFEFLERETTQPVRRYFEPRHVHDIAPADIAHAVDFEVPSEPIAPAESSPPSAADAALEPWPDPLRMQPASAEPASIEPIAEEPAAPPAAIDEVDAPVELEPPPTHQAIAVPYEGPEQQQQPASTHAFEPQPFAVPPPGVYRSPGPPAPEPQ
ncbi:MAG: hypothetical protein ABI457_07420, partial [Hyphomicrobium sp.]